MRRCLRSLAVASCFLFCSTCALAFLNPLLLRSRKKSPSSQILSRVLESEARLFSTASMLSSLFMSETSSEGEGNVMNSTFHLPNRSRRTQYKNTVIVGSGLAGLSTALYLSQLDPERHITILDKQEHDVEIKKKTTISSFAAAGMLAPQSERLPKGNLLNLCLASRRMYPQFVELVETMAKEAREEGAKYLFDNSSKEHGLDPWSVGYIASGGFLAPAFAGDSVATWAPPSSGGTATWLDEIQVRELEPSLHPDVVGGWWFPEDASVDARRLTCSLHAACLAAGVQFLCGKQYEVTSLDLNDGKCHGLWLQNGKYFKTKTILVANGAWMRNLLPVPVEPHKGQSLSLKMPSDRPPILRRVLFSQDSYIVPKADGHIVIGATVEAGSFDGNVTPAGLLHILTHALQVVPGLQNLPVAETWAGLRPTTPDKGPILGTSPWENLFLAGGYWRNGVLLAPKTAQLLACLITGNEMSPDDEKLLTSFSWDRFTVKGGGSALAANARYAASMHPIHSRASGAGVAAAVGTELGSYSTARAAKDERQKERRALWGDDDDEAAFERAAELGRRDATTFSMGGEQVQTEGMPDSPRSSTASPVFFPETNGEDRHTEAEEEEKVTPANDIASVYQSIQKNKNKQAKKLSADDVSEERADPGFRIYHIDSLTGESREVPPFTSPGEFLEAIEQGERSPTVAESNKNEIDMVAEEAAGSINEALESVNSPYGEKTHDSSRSQLDSHPETTRSEKLDNMRRARIKNRPLQQSSVDESNIGVAKTELTTPNEDIKDQSEVTTEPTADIASAYQVILDNKSKQNLALSVSLPKDEECPEPGFRIYHIDSVTGEAREVPPFTSPGDFLESIGRKEKTQTEMEGKQPKISPEEINGISNKKKVEHNGINGNRDESSESGYSEKTYDGYQAILDANSGNSRADQLEAMHKARQANRLGQTGIDESKFD